jgi:DNA-binding protein H-NS
MGLRAFIGQIERIVSMDDLKSLFEQKAKIESQIEAAKQQAKLEFAQKVADTLEGLKNEAEILGFDLADFGISAKVRKSRKKPEPKYRHPSNAELTWTGAGRTPKWVLEYEEIGGSRDELLIKKD